MPQRVLCNNCRAILYEGNEVKPPYKVIHHYGGECPNYGIRLSYTPIKIEIKPSNKNRIVERSISA